MTVTLKCYKAISFHKGFIYLKENEIPRAKIQKFWRKHKKFSTFQQTATGSYYRKKCLLPRRPLRHRGDKYIIF